MKKSLLVASLAVVSMNVMGMSVDRSRDAASSSMRSIPTASPMVFPANQQAISTEKLKEMIKLPEYPEGYKEDFLVDWRELKLDAFRSVIGLTEEKINEWRKSKKRLIQRNDSIFKDLLKKIKTKKDELCDKYREVSTKDNIYKLIEYRDYMLIRFDDSCSSHYKMAMYCNNGSQKHKETLSWLENNELTERPRITEEEREGILSQIIENKQFKQIQEIYPKLQKQTYNNYVRSIKYWFSFTEQELFKKKINGEELDKELKPLGLEKSTLDTDALADLIRCGRSNFIGQYKDYSYESYNDIASVWKILAAKNFEKPNWCNGGAILAEQMLETNKNRSESIITTRKAITIARNYLKLIDKDLPGNTYRPDKQRNVISFYKWKLDEYESTDPKKSIRGTNSEFIKNAVYEEVRKYFDLNHKDIQRIFEPYRGSTKELRKLKVTNKEEYDRILDGERSRYHAISAKNIADEIDTAVRKYQEKYNILDVLNDNRSGKEVDPEAQSESQKIVRDLWKIGFSYERVIELLGLKDDFEASYPSTAENLTDSSSDAGSSSSSSAAQTRKRNADSTVELTNSQKRNKGKQRAED